MSLAAGSLRHRIEIHAVNSQQDPTDGQITEAWSLFADAWADVRALSAREFLASSAEHSNVVVMVKIRYLAGVTRSMRIRHGERLYNIEGVLPDPVSGREFLTLPCSEVVNG